jgi:hypothetical protein
MTSIDGTGGPPATTPADAASLAAPADGASPATTPADAASLAAPADGASPATTPADAASPAAPAGEGMIPPEPVSSPQAGTAPASRWRQWPRRVAPMVRRHWLVSALLVAGLVLRVLAQISYRPALVYVDTLKYLYGVYPGSDPLGYRWLLKVVLLAGDLGVMAAIQHLLGLAMAVVLYVVLLRRGVNRWLSALAVAPVLLDAYQIQMEQTIMPDVWFEAIIVAGLAVLLWKPAMSVRAVAAAGLILGASATLRQVGVLLILPAVLYLLAAGGGWRTALGKSAALAAAFALPILGYMSISYARTGHFWLARGQSSIGRMAYAADCKTLKLPAYARPICPSPSAQAHGPDWLEHSKYSPLFATPVPPGTTRRKMLAALSTAVKTQQPLRVAVSILRDSIRLYVPVRQPIESVTPISRWQFQTSYPTYPPWITLGPKKTIIVGLQRGSFSRFHLRPLNPSYGGKAQVNKPLATFLHAYQLDGGYTPGPLLALFTLTGLAGSVLALRRRHRGTRTHQLALASLLFTGAVVAILILPDMLEFSWRYQLPAVIILPPAGVLGIAALLSRRRERRAARPQTAKEPGEQPA